MLRVQNLQQGGGWVKFEFSLPIRCIRRPPHHSPPPSLTTQRLGQQNTTAAHYKTRRIFNAPIMHVDSAASAANPRGNNAPASPTRGRHAPMLGSAESLPSSGALHVKENLTLPCHASEKPIERKSCISQRWRGGWWWWWWMKQH